MRDGQVFVFVGVRLLELGLDVAPDGVARLVVGLEEAAGLVGDRFKIADEGGAVGVVAEEGLKARVGADVAVAVGEEVGQVLLKIRGSHGVEVGEPGV